MYNYNLYIQETNLLVSQGDGLDYDGYVVCCYIMRLMRARFAMQEKLEN